MNLPRRLMAMNLKPLLASALVAAAAMTGAAVLGTNPDAFVARSFTTALAEPAPSEGPSVPVAGTEDFWLGKSHASNPAAIERVAWSGPAGGLILKVGDRITVTSGASSRVLDVVAITGTSTTSQGHLVTARDTQAPGAPLVTFTAPVPATPAKTAEAL